MSVRVTDPAGVEWEVSREWLRVPTWARDQATLDTMGVPGVDLPLDEVRGLVAIALILLVRLLGVLLLFVVLPLLSLLFALAVAAVLLLARVTGVAT